MKLLVLADGLESAALDPAGSWMSELTSRLAGHGHRVTVVCTRPLEAGEVPEDPPGVSVWRPAEGALADALASALAAGPDVVHVAVTGALPASVVSLLEQKPLLLDLLDWSALCPAGDLLLRPHGLACEHHHPVAPCGACVGHSRMRAMEPLLSLARAGHRLLAHAGHVRDRATLALGRGVALLPVGVDSGRFRPDPADPLAPEIAMLASDRRHPRVVLLGPPTLARGGPRALDLLIALNARVPGVELVVAGSDPGNPDSLHVLLAEAKELGLASQLTLIPRVARGDLPALLAACDVGVAPGMAPEPLGLSIVQALAVGLPVVAHPTGSTSSLLGQGRCGVLAGAGVMGLFADSVAGLLGDPAARATLGEQARLAAIERHEIERAVFDTEALYERVRTLRGVGCSGTPPRGRRAAA